MSSLPLKASVSTTRVSFAVTAAAGSAGDVVANTTASTEVRLRNTGIEPVEYKVDAGAWVVLQGKSSTLLDINLASQVVRTRRAVSAVAGTVELEITQFLGGYKAGDEPINLGLKLPINPQTGTAYTLALADAGGQVDMNNAAANTVTIPLNATVPFDIGAVVMVCMQGAGVTTIAATGGVTMVKPAARDFAINGQYEKAELHKVAVDTWRVLA